ncbi:T9SS type A sorting domain-containing protein [candidate division KSB1 bacterium]
MNNDYGLPVEKATVIFTDEVNTSITQSCTTDVDGKYQLSLLISSITDFPSIIPTEFTLSQNYPNPFNPTTNIPFSLNKTASVNLSIYNILGQKIKTLINRVYLPGQHIARWDGSNNNGSGVSAGIYLYRIVVDGEIRTKKMTLIDGAVTSSPVFSVTQHIPAGLKKTQETTYKVNIVGEGIIPFEQTGVIISSGESLDFIVEENVRVPFAVQGNYLGVYNGVGYDQLFVKGVNLGVAVPGTQPGELAASKDQYDRWLNKMGEMDLNTLRIYTLHYPRFYEAFYEYNSAHPENPLYLFQGIWLNEENPGHDLEQLSQEFNLDIEEVIDCVHGNRTIESRFGKAYGAFSTDISKWVIGYILGREIFPDEVLNTNLIHEDSTSFNGEILQLTSATPSEIWTVKKLDKTIRYERDTYDVERPVSLSSWPTLDPLTHPTEDSTLSDEDKAFIDLNDVEIINAPAGIFASFHAYPYYPDFISEDPDYIQFSDQDGPNSYLGYLTDLKNHYNNMPLIIAEFGVPSSWGNAHFAHSGMHQGGFDEKQQGDYNVRIMQNIYDTDCGGGLLFSWIDEWFKQSWITNPIGPEVSRRPLWHNVTNPEQNYGLISFDQEQPDYSEFNTYEDAGKISKIEADIDNEYFHVRITLDSALTVNDSLIIGFDTYRNDLGESMLPGGAVVVNRAEFALIITNSDTSQLYVTEAYDLFGIYHNVAGPEQLFHSVPTDNAQWNLVRWKNNYYEDAIYNIGILRKREISETSTSLDAVIIDDNVISVRIPWTLLQFTDPSLMEVMHDDRNTVERETTISDGLAISVSLGGSILETNRYYWNSWNVAPSTVERDKESMQIFTDGLTLLPDYISTPAYKIIINNNK